MTYNREQRCFVADLIASYMRGKITNVEYLQDGTEYLAMANQDSGLDDAASNAFFWGRMADDPEAVECHFVADRVIRDILLRHLAFLESELVPRTAESIKKPKTILKPIGLAVVLAIVLFCVSWWQYGWLLAIPIAWIGSGIIALVAAHLWNREYFRRDVENQWQPFTDEQQWLDHKHLLDRFELPECDSTTMTRRQKKNEHRWRKCVGWITGTILGLLVVIIGLPMLLIALPVLVFFLMKPEKVLTDYAVDVNSLGE